MKFASLFSGGDLAGVGARMAGLTPIWGIEYDLEIAAIAELNGTQIIVSKVQDADFSQLESPDWLHMSPPCINASVAKTDAGEAPEDIEMAQGCIRAIRRFKSPYVSLENVWGYRNFESFQLIYAALMELGYQIRFWHLCSADFGVAQTRKRLILVASLKGTPKRPEQTHSQDGHVGFFETMPKWIGWYEAIEDLIPSLPESAFAEWQLIRLQENIGTQMVGGGNTNKEIIDSPSRSAGDPMFTVSTHSPGNNRAFLVGKSEISNTVRDINPRYESEPAATVKAGDFRRASEIPKAFLVHNNDQRTMPVRDGDDPSFTVMAGGNNSHDPGIKPKAFIASCHQLEGAELTIPISEADEPSVSVGCHSAGHHRAFLMPGGNSSSAEPREPREPREPSQTIGDTKRVGNIPRAFLVDRINYNSATVRDGSEPAFTESVYDSQHQGPQAFLVNETRDLSLRTETEPAAGIVAERGGRERAFIVDGKPANYVGDLRIVDAEDPSPTATATATRHPMRAWLSQGKVVALTVRALARLQSIPDSYRLPEKNSLGCRIVGNAIPPLLMQRIIEAQLHGKSK